MKISDKIKQRLELDSKRFFAADNISKYIHPGETAELIEELEVAFE